MLWCQAKNLKTIYLYVISQKMHLGSDMNPKPGTTCEAFCHQ